MGIEALACEVEVDCADRGFEKATVVGRPDAVVKGSLERVRAERFRAGRRKLTTSARPRPGVGQSVGALDACGGYDIPMSNATTSNRCDQQSG